MVSISRFQRVLSHSARLGAQRSLHQTQSQPIHTLESCPEPTCACTSTPTDLDIERENSMLNAVPSYNKHVMFLTGHADWPTKIEGFPGKDKDNVVSALKKYLREDRQGNPNVINQDFLYKFLP